MKTLKTLIELFILAILPVVVILLTTFILSYVAGIGWRLGG